MHVDEAARRTVAALEQPFGVLTIVEDVAVKGVDSLEADELGFLQEAVRLALDNVADGQLPFGALVVRDGRVLATGVNTTLRDHDPTAHGEVAAVRAACRDLGSLELTGATVVSSCEPCPMCRAVSLVAGVSRIIYAAPKEYVPDLGVTLPPIVSELAAAWRHVGADQLRYVPTPGADQPFTRFLERSGRR